MLQEVDALLQDVRVAVRFKSADSPPQFPHLKPQGFQFLLRHEVQGSMTAAQFQGPRLGGRRTPGPVALHGPGPPECCGCLSTTGVWTWTSPRPPGPLDLSVTAAGKQMENPMPPIQEETITPRITMTVTNTRDNIQHGHRRNHTRHGIQEIQQQTQT